MLRLSALPERTDDGSESDSSTGERRPGAKSPRSPTSGAGSPPGKQATLEATDAPEGDVGELADAAPLTDAEVDSGAADYDAARVAAGADGTASPAPTDSSVSAQMGAASLGPPASEPGACALPAPASAASAPAAQEYTGETNIFSDVIGATVFTFPPLSFSERVSMKNCITEEAAYKAYAAVVKAAGIPGISLVPLNGVSALPGKPIYIFNDYESARRLADAVSEFEFEFDQFTKLKFSVKARKFEKDSGASNGFISVGSFSSSFVENETVYFALDIPPELQPFVSADNIKASLRNEYIVIRGKQKQMTSELPDGSKVSLGNNWRTPFVNIIVKPFGKRVLDYDYPELIHFYYYEHGVKKHAALPYRMGGCSDEMKAKISKLFCKKTHRRIKDCSHCKAAASAGTASAGGGPSRPRFTRAEHAERRAQAVASFALKSGIKKKDLLCKYYLSGKCNSIHEGKRCGMTHDSRAAATIPCHWGLKCTKPTCGYLHTDLSKHRALLSPSKVPAMSRIDEGAEP